MQTLLLKFPGRRYHATPWGHHVNEGLIEWPPSPWRILRSLLAVGYSSGFWNGEGPGQIGRSLIQKLAAVLPTYRLPPAVGAHSRHYMPTTKLKGGQEDKTMVFDTWAQLNGGTLSILWDVELPSEERQLFSSLADRLNYVGRSESWVSARLAQPSEPLPDGYDCYPSEAPPHPGWEQVPLMAAQNNESYTQWRQESLAQALSGVPEVDQSKSKLTGKDKKALALREKIEAQYPPDVIACLHVQTSWLRQHGWSQSPGSRKVFYRRPTDALEPIAPRPINLRPIVPKVAAMLLSISSVARSAHALPPTARTLPQAELLHRALVNFAAKRSLNCPVLSGCDAFGKPLRGPHEHAHILPLDLDDDNHLDHILIWAPMGLDAQAQQAIRAVRRTYTKGGVGPLGLALAGIGSLEELCCVEGIYGDRLRRIVMPADRATNWRSITPFVLPRFTKKNGRNTFEGQIASELSSRGIDTPLQIAIIDLKKDEGALRQRHFIRTRRNGPEPPMDCGFSLKLVFAKPIKGPLCLGYGSHFGLGLFEAEHDID